MSRKFVKGNWVMEICTQWVIRLRWRNIAGGYQAIKNQSLIKVYGQFNSANL